MLTLREADVVARVDPDRGGRLSSLEVDGLELLVASDPDPMVWGCYPMVPWAGRVRRGAFAFDGHHHQLPIDLAPHAIHGLGYTRAWSTVDPSTIELMLTEPWPFAGTVRQSFELGEDRLTITMAVTAHEPMPLTMGWHPWFRRELGRGGAAELTFEAGALYVRDADGIPTGELIDPPPGPWDDCFTQLGDAPRLRWPDALELTVEHDCSHLVVYDEPAHALCVEPQTGPPDAFTLEPEVLAAGAERTARMTLRWRRLRRITRLRNPWDELIPTPR